MPIERYGFNQDWKPPEFKKKGSARRFECVRFRSRTPDSKALVEGLVHFNSKNI